MSGKGRLAVGSTGDEVVMKDIECRSMAVTVLGVAPAQGSAGKEGEIRWTADNIYLCVKLNTWVRASLATFK